jgi:hypothetical protein
MKRKTKSKKNLPFKKTLPIWTALTILAGVSIIARPALSFAALVNFNHQMLNLLPQKAEINRLQEHK